MTTRKDGAALREIARLHIQAQRQTSACCGGTTLTQCAMITQIGKEGALKIGELGSRLGLEKSWTGRAVERLTRHGLLAVDCDPADARGKRVSLTAAGRRRYAALNESLDAHAGSILDRIPREHRESVSRSLKLILEALQSETRTKGERP